MINKISIIVMSSLLLLSGSLMGQRHQHHHGKSQDISEVKIKVLDKNRNPIPRATVLFPEIGISAQTDAAGICQLKIPRGTYHFEVVKEGFMPYRSDRISFNEEVFVLEVFIMNRVEEEIVVTATRRAVPIKETPVRTEVISESQIEVSGAMKVSEVLDKELPGCSVNTSCTNCNFTELRMQGLEGGYSQILIDGLPLFSGLALVYGLEQLRTENIEKIEVLKGASSALYGAQAIGGVVNILTREPSLKPEFSLDVSYGSFETYDLSARGSYRKGAVGVIATAQKGGNAYVDRNSDDFTDKVETNNLNLSLKTNIYLLKDMHRIGIFGRYIDEFRRGGFIPNIDDPLDELGEHIWTDRYEYGLSYQGIFRSSNILKISLAGTTHKRHATNSARPFDSDEQIYVADAQYSHQLFDGRHIITGGVTLKDERITEVINYQLAPEKRGTTGGVYLQDEIKASENVDLVLGCRYDHTKSTHIEASSLSPRLALRWQLAPEFSLRTSIGTGFRVPYLFVEELHLCSAAPLIYNAGNLEPEKSLSYSVSGEYYTPRLFFDFNFFRTLIRKKTYFSKESAPPGFDFVYLNGGNAWTQGLEARANFSVLSNLKLKTALTLTDARYEEPQDYGVGKSPHIMRTPLATARLNLEYNDLRNGLTVSLVCRVTGPMYIENYVEEKIEKTSTYGLWDFRLIKKFSDHLEFSLILDNIFDYIQPKTYNALVDESAAYIYAPLVGRYVAVRMGIHI